MSNITPEMWVNSAKRYMEFYDVHGGEPSEEEVATQWGLVGLSEDVMEQIANAMGGPMFSLVLPEVAIGALVTGLIVGAMAAQEAQS